MYGEKHHIVPKSLGGSDSSDNIVKLTAREHFICHALLAEMYERYTFEWYKMNHAFMMMKASNSRHIRYMNSRIYESKRHDFKVVQSYNQTGEKNSQFGKPRSEETRLKIGNALRKTKPTKIDERSLYTLNGVFANKYRRKRIFEIFNIDIENSSKTLQDVYNLLVDLYIVKRLSLNEIANMFRTNNENIRNYLKFFNIERRTISESLKLHASIRMRQVSKT
jgi:predicted DNA-binding protein YlxM (UPF0122 family)